MVAKCEADVFWVNEAIGTDHAFTGPIKNHKSEIVVQDGARMSDDDLLKMNWYGEGVTV